MSAQHTQGQVTDNALRFSVWRETNVLPRSKLAAFAYEVDALNFAERRARIEGENDADIDTTVWVLCYGEEVFYKTFRAAISKATWSQE